MPPVETRSNKLRSFIQQANESLTRTEFKASFARVVSVVKLAQQQLEQRISHLLEQAHQDLEARIDRRLALLKDGAQGPRGEKGDTIIGPIGPKGDKGDQGVPGIAGTPGKDADVKDAVRRVLPQVLAEIDKRVPLLGDALRFGLEAHVKDTLSRMDFGPGAGTSFSIMQSGTLKVQQPLSLDFKGAGAPTVTIGQNGVTHLDFPSGGGSGFTELTATGTVNSVNAAFTFTQKPSYVVSDGVWMKENRGWTWSGSTATLSIPPTADIYGVA